MAFSNPIKNLDSLGIPEGAHVADFGCGSGFYTMAAARKVGEEGRVFAIDVQQDLLSRVATEAAAEELENVDVIAGDIATRGGTQLEDASIDVVILSNVLFQTKDIEGVFNEMYRVLKTGGRCLVVEWRDSFGGLGPQEEDIVSEQSVRTIAEEKSFQIQKEIDAGDHHYGFSIKKMKDRVL